MPAIVKEHYIARPGYVNYYFNQLNTDRVWRALASRGDMSALAGKWTIRGTLASGGDFEIELSDKQALAAAFPAAKPKCNLTGSAGRIARSARQRRTVGHAGHVAAVAGRRPEAVWRLVLFGYQPRCPTVPAWPTCLVGTYGGVETRFLVDPGDGALRAVEMWPDDDTDPCELYFADYHEHDGRMLPGRLEVHFGDGIYQVFTCKQFQFEPAGEP